MKLNKKTFLISALIGSVGIGVYYMGKKKIIQNLLSQGVISIGSDGKFYLNCSGENKLIEVEKENGSKYYIENKSDGNAFDYNNPNFHSPADYVNVNEQSGEVKPSVWQSIKAVFGF